MPTIDARASRDRKAGASSLCLGASTSVVILPLSPQFGNNIVCSIPLLQHLRVLPSRDRRPALFSSFRNSILYKMMEQENSNADDLVGKVGTDKQSRFVSAWRALESPRTKIVDWHKSSWRRRGSA